MTSEVSISGVQSFAPGSPGAARGQGVLPRRRDKRCACQYGWSRRSCREPVEPPMGFQGFSGSLGFRISGFRCLSARGCDAPHWRRGGRGRGLRWARNLPSLLRSRGLPPGAEAAEPPARLRLAAGGAAGGGSLGGRTAALGAGGAARARSSLVSGLWSLVSSLQSPVSGLCSPVSGLQSLVSSFWSPVSGLWTLDSGL